MRKLPFLAAIPALLLAIGLAYAAPKSKTPSSKQPPTENQKLCRNGELKEEITNPVCLRWQITNVGTVQQENDLYKMHYEKACYDGSDGNIRCFFMHRARNAGHAQTVTEAKAFELATGGSSGSTTWPRKACEAYADIQTKWSAQQNPPTTPASERPFCGNGQIPSPGGVLDSQQFMCGLCLQGQNGCTTVKGKGKFVSGSACINFSGAPIQLTDVLLQPQASFCGTEISGPYSEFAQNHSYNVCGKAQTQTYRGMVFTEDQKNQIRNINKQSTTNGTNTVKSDFAGFCWPRYNNMECVETAPGSDICIEQENLVNFPFQAWNSGQVHHILPRTDKRECACGTNSVANAAIISNHLNQYFLNNNRNQLISACSGQTEVEFANSRPKRVLP